MLSASISSVVKKIKQLLEGEFRRVIVRGEVSNLSKSHSGHWYFTLSDENSSLSCVLFRADAVRNPIISTVADGQEVICSGSIGVYAPRGSFQLIANQVIVDGKGDLLERYEKLKEKLQKRGFFDEAHKKKIPSDVKRIALITARDGAALHDFINVYRRIARGGEIILIPALVQGKESAKSLRHALSLAQNSLDNIDLIVLTRGGGSTEDLWSFNDEQLASDIFNCSIPVVSAVGHQIDFTISDFVADLRAETPTAAAELVAKRQAKAHDQLNESLRLLKILAAKKIDLLKGKVLRLRPELSPLLKKFHQYQQRLNACDFTRRDFVGISEKLLKLDEGIFKLERALQVRILELKHRLNLAQGKLEVLGPQGILERGYTIIEDDKGRSVNSFDLFSGLEKKQRLIIHFSDGAGKVLKDD